MLPPLPGLREALDQLQWLGGQLGTATVSYDLGDLRGYAYYSGMRFGIYTPGASDALVRVNTPFFSGWHMSLDGRPVALERAADSGYMQVGVPAGLHILEARFDNTLVRRVANVTSVGSLLLLSLFVITYVPAAYRREPRRPSFEPSATAGCW